MSKITLFYSLSQVGQKAALLAGLPAGRIRSCVLVADDPAFTTGLPGSDLWPLAVELASVAPNGDAELLIGLVAWGTGRDRDLRGAPVGWQLGAPSRYTAEHRNPERPKIEGLPFAGFDSPTPALRDLLTFERDRRAAESDARTALAASWRGACTAVEAELAIEREAAKAERVRASCAWLAERTPEELMLPAVVDLAAHLDAGGDPIGHDISGQRWDWAASSAVHKLGELRTLEAKAAREAEILDNRRLWASAHGSERLKVCLADDVECSAILRDEWLAIRMPGFVWLVDAGFETIEARNPSADAVRQLVEVRTHEPTAYIQACKYSEDDTDPDDPDDPEGRVRGYAIEVWIDESRHAAEVAGLGISQRYAIQEV